MKKLLERLRAGGERTQLLLSVAGIAVVVIAAMLLPLAFRGNGGGDAPKAESSRKSMPGAHPEPKRRIVWKPQPKNCVSLDLT